MLDLYDASQKPVDQSTSPVNIELPPTSSALKGPTIGPEVTPPIVSVEKLQTKQAIRNFLPRKAGTSLSSLIILPSSKVHFETQDVEEEVLVILRSHWLTNLPWVSTAIVLVLAPQLLNYFPLLVGFPARFQSAFIVVWYLISIMYVFEKFLSWFFNLGIITDERIIDVNMNGLTGRKIADAELDKIQDVTFVNSGVFGTIFNYGDVLVQTAAEMVQFVFNDVPQPSKVAEILQKMRIEEKQEALEGRVR